MRGYTGAWTNNVIFCMMLSFFCTTTILYQLLGCITWVVAAKWAEDLRINSDMFILYRPLARSMATVSCLPPGNTFIRPGRGQLSHSLIYHNNIVRVNTMPTAIYRLYACRSYLDGNNGNYVDSVILCFRQRGNGGDWMH